MATATCGRWIGLGCALAAMVVAGACGEDLLAPSNGICPDYCPPERLAVSDSLLPDAVVSDSTYSGYVQPWDAPALQVYRDSTADGESGSRVVYQFLPFSDSLQVVAGDLTKGAVVGTDSFRLELPILARNTEQTGLELLLYRLPIGLDSGIAFADLDSYFTDSTQIAVVAVDDSLVAASVFATVDSVGFPAFFADDGQVAIGVALRTPRGYVRLGGVGGSSAPVLTRYARVDSVGTAVPRTEGKLAKSNTVAGTPLPPLNAGEHATGGLPSIRTLLRLALPLAITDSATVVRATLILVPTGPAIGPPGDSVRILAQGVTADVGPKSPLEVLSTVAAQSRIVAVPVGAATDTIRLDLTSLVLAWGQDSTLPRALVVRASPEGASLGEVRFGTVANGASRPSVQITYVPPVALGGR